MIDFSSGLDSANRHARGLLHPISCKRRLLLEILVFNLARLVLSSLGENQLGRDFLAFDSSKMKCCGGAVLRNFMHGGFGCYIAIHVCLLQSWNIFSGD